METFLTRAITIVALTCVLVVGAAATSILGRDSVPAVPAHFAAAAIVAKSPVPTARPKPTSCRLRPMRLRPSSRSERCNCPSRSARPMPRRSCRSRADVSAPAPAAAPVAAAPVAPPKPKAAKPAPAEELRAAVSDVQIAGIKERLKLSPDQVGLLARRREGAARHRPQDPFDQADRACRRYAADRHGLR